jgi:hypothetical protein
MTCHAQPALNFASGHIAHVLEEFSDLGRPMFLTFGTEKLRRQSSASLLPAMRNPLKGKPAISGHGSFSWADKTGS